jgi:hypothetical protein
MPRIVVVTLVPDRMKPRLRSKSVSTLAQEFGTADLSAFLHVYPGECARRSDSAGACADRRSGDHVSNVGPGESSEPDIQPFKSIASNRRRYIGRSLTEKILRAQPIPTAPACRYGRVMLVRAVRPFRAGTIDNNELLSVGVDRLKKVGDKEKSDVIMNRTETIGINDSLTVRANRIKSVLANETASVKLKRSPSVGTDETIDKNQRTRLPGCACQRISGCKRGR